VSEIISILILKRVLNTITTTVLRVSSTIYLYIVIFMPYFVLCIDLVIFGVFLWNILSTGIKKLSLKSI
jgi:hypothetical protein